MVAIALHLSHKSSYELPCMYIQSKRLYKSLFCRLGHRLSQMMLSSQAYKRISIKHHRFPYLLDCFHDTIQIQFQVKDAISALCKPHYHLCGISSIAHLTRLKMKVEISYYTISIALKLCDMTICRCICCMLCKVTLHTLFN